jgi:hypothetical protein
MKKETQMQIEIVCSVEHRYIHPIKQADGTTVDELIPGRSVFGLVLELPNGKRIFAEVSEEAFASYRTQV